MTCQPIEKKATGSGCNISETVRGHLKKGVWKTACMNTLRDLQDIVVERAGCVRVEVRVCISEPCK